MRKARNTSSYFRTISTRPWTDSSSYSKYYRPGSLVDARKKGILLTQLEKMKVARDLLKGFKNLNHKNILHRDLKPENVLLDIKNHANGRTVEGVICDLGLAHYRKKGEKVQFAHGTPVYAPPEGFVSKNLSWKHSKKFEVYAMGCVLYYLRYEKMPEWITKTLLNGSCDNLKGKDVKKVITKKIASKSSSIKKKIQPKEKSKKNKKHAKKSTISPSGEFQKLILDMVQADPKKRGDAKELYLRIDKIYQKAIA